MKFIFLLFATFLVINFAFGFQWDSHFVNKQTVYAPISGNVTFPWSYSLNPGEHVQFIQYFLNSQLVALETHGSFFPERIYNSRVIRSGLAGIIFQNASESDSGEMTITIDVKNSHGVVSIHNTSMILQVLRGNNDLSLNLESRLNQMELDFKLQLAQFKTQQETEVAHLNNKLNQQGSEINQLKIHISQQDTALIQSKNYSVLLENQITQMQIKYNTEILQLKTKQENDISRLKNNLTVQDVKFMQTKNEIDQLTLNWNRLEIKTHTQVIFYSRYLDNSANNNIAAHVPSNGVFKCVDVTLNLGGGYDSTTGLFTAPHSGFYSFSASGGGYHGNQASWFGIYLAVDGVRSSSLSVALFESQDQLHVSDSLTCHLNKGQTVSVRPFFDVMPTFYTNRFSFMGHLIALD